MFWRSLDDPSTAYFGARGGPSYRRWFWPSFDHSLLVSDLGLRPSISPVPGPFSPRLNASPSW